jgi:hypothetical protein
MPRYFFNIYDHVVTHDEEGVELENNTEIIKEIQNLLPKVVLNELPANGDRQLFAVVVTDETKKPVYVATLSYNGIMLSE